MGEATEWKSREKALVKIIEPKSGSAYSERIIVLGTDATGWGYARKLRGDFLMSKMKEECTITLSL